LLWIVADYAQLSCSSGWVAEKALRRRRLLPISSLGTT
jgi:hypothetical protein